MINLVNLGEKIIALVARNDRALNTALTQVRSDNLDNLFLWITSFGSWPIIVGGALLLSFFIWKKKKIFYLIPFWLALGGANLTSLIGKLYFARLRPVAPVYWENTFSFPSGHAINTLFFYGFVVYFLIKFLPQRKQKILISLTGILVIILVGFSRLFLGVHYLSDVISGYIIGALWLYAAIQGVKLFIAPKK